MAEIRRAFVCYRMAISPPGLARVRRHLRKTVCDRRSNLEIHRQGKGRRFLEDQPRGAIPMSDPTLFQLPPAEETPVPRQMIAELEAVGAGGQASDVLRATAPEDRRNMHAFILHWSRAGERHLDCLYKAAIRGGSQSDHPGGFGGISLAGWARVEHPRFCMGNDIAGLYVAALRVRHPELAQLLEVNTPSAHLLLDHGWGLR
jgi:hypothetical protein